MAVYEANRQRELGTENADVVRVDSNNVGRVRSELVNPTEGWNPVEIEIYHAAGRFGRLAMLHMREHRLRHYSRLLMSGKLATDLWMRDVKTRWAIRRHVRERVDYGRRLMIHRLRSRNGIRR